jgi:hypothetical protein
LVRLFVVLGFALLAGGAYAIVDGWPYRVLESGFTEVILGGLSLAVGLILLALATVLAEVRRLKGLVSGAMAVTALSEPRYESRLLPSEAPARAEQMLETAPVPEAGHVGIATTVAAGAGAAVAAGALAGLAKTADEPDGKPTDKADEAEKTEEGHKTEGVDSARSDRPETATAEPSQLPSAAAGDIDDWLLPPVPPVLDAAPSDVHPDERGENNETGEQADTSQDEPEPTVPVDAEGVPKPADDKAGEVEPAAATLDEPEAKPAEDEAVTAKPEPVTVEARDDQLWWPRIDRPAREQSASVDDEFNALRDQLAGVVNAPEVESPRRDRDALDTVGSWMAPRPWPPVTQPRDPGAMSEVEAGDKGSPEEAKAEPSPTQQDEPAAAEPEAESREEDAEEPASITAETLPAEKTGASLAETKLAEEPAASEEGVIGAYQVGETQFTMFADGSIHARTPDGDYVFASMDELKAYLASEKDKLEPSSS